MQKQLTNKRQKLALASRELNVISPLQTLERGYAIALHAESGVAIKTPSDAKQGDRLNIKLAQGQVSAIVE
jgi:exodeoxyribonuclease VII large subunit